jgi:membrane-associated phospholipid phosphatase
MAGPTFRVERMTLAAGSRSATRTLRMRLRAAIVFLVATASFVGVYLIAVRTTSGQIVENRALETSLPQYESLGLLRLVSVQNLALASAALIAIALLSRRVDAAIRVVAILGLSNALTQVLKYHVLSRPDFFEDWTTNTFPSGHTVAYASVLVSLLIVAPARSRYLLALVIAVPMGIVSYQLLEYGWHRLSDVLGGLLLVTLLAALTFVVRPERLPHRRPPVRRFVLALLGASALGSALGAGILVVMVFLGDGLTDAGVLLAATELATTAMVCTMLVLILGMQDSQRSTRTPTAGTPTAAETRTKPAPELPRYAALR